MMLKDRKNDHIELAFQSVLKSTEMDDRFYYDPLLSGLPVSHEMPVTFLNKTLHLPLWVSSMTGGTEKAGHINRNLARACKDFQFGMGLGSCRSLLDNDVHLKDFDVRDIIGEDLPLFGNLGIAQIDDIVDTKKYYLIKDLIDKLRLDGLIVHINPLQEAMQPEGDQYENQPVAILSELLEHVHFPIIVKEVGQGMGKESLRNLFQLPLAAVDFGARGGTNFALLELMRTENGMAEQLAPLAGVGHSALEMVDFTNTLIEELGTRMLCKQIIISGGIRNFLDGFYLIRKLKTIGIYGQASAFLKYALKDYETLYAYIKTQAKGLALANAFLSVKESI
jgi:isopentenyl-diphosphate delta-isomerase